jgi:hypothetical protein
MKRVYTQIRLDEGLHGRLKAIAAAEHRSLNNLMEYFLLRQVGEYEREQPDVLETESPKRDQAE